MGASVSTDFTGCDRRYWDEIGPRYLELFRDELEQKSFDRELLVHYAEQLPHGATVLDIGCGPCTHVSDLLRSHGVRVIGGDISPVCLRLAREQRPEEAWAVMDMAALPFVDAALDGIVAYYTIHYAPKSALPRILYECRRVLKPGGLLLVTAKEGMDEGFIPDPLGTDLQPYFALFTEAELVQALAEAGFEPGYRQVREPYPAEIASRRIYVIARRPG